jgi:hypothetical protein
MPPKGEYDPRGNTAVVSCGVIALCLRRIGLLAPIVIINTSGLPRAEPEP